MSEHNEPPQDEPDEPARDRPFFQRPDAPKFNLPKVDLSQVNLPKVDLSNITLPKINLDSTEILAEIERLQEIFVASRFACAATQALASSTGDCQDAGILAALLQTQPAGDFTAVEVR